MSDAELTAADIDLPIKRTDGETLEDRLTANAYHNILPARYLQQDADGELIEDQEELFERVAKNIALAEAAFEAERRDIDVTVTPAEVKPDHPRRDELAAEVFGVGTTVEDDVETSLTPENVHKFAYDTVVPTLPASVRDHVEDTADEFQELMERLSFTPNCVPPDSLVASEGGVRQLSQIQPSDRVYDDVDGDARVESKFENGTKRVMELKTSHGYSVRATPEHYFRVIDSTGAYVWRQVKDIRDGDYLALQRNFLDDDAPQTSLKRMQPLSDGGTAAAEVVRGRPREPIDVPTRMTPAFAEWLGLYYGDGTARESGVRVAFDSQDRDLVDRWVDLTEQLFDFIPTTGDHKEANCVIAHASRRELYRFLDENGLLKASSETAVIPSVVLESGRSVIAAFIRGLFEADGTVSQRSIELYSHSEDLIHQVQLLLLGLGIRSKRKEKRDGYRLTIRKNVCGERFVDSVGFISERKKERAQRFEEFEQNATSCKIPNQADALLEWYRESDLGHEAYRDLSQFLIDGSSEYAQEIGEDIFERYLEKYPELEDSPVYDHVQREQFYDEVIERTEIGSMPVEDMHVPRRNTYVVEGFVSHNSPTLMNAGGELQQLSACFVMSPDDDLSDIHETAKKAAEVFQSGGGVGYGFWQLRPYGDTVGSTGGIASGPITFMRTYDQLCFPPGTDVLTPDGQRPIETLRPGELVIDEHGDGQPVVDTLERVVDEEIVEITPERLNTPIQATREHPFKVATEDGFEWVDAEDLKVGDYVVLGHSREENGLALDTPLDLSEIASGPLVLADGGITVNRQHFGATKGPRPTSINQEVRTDDFATVAGWYLAEGCVVYRRGIPSEVTFTLNYDEVDAAGEICAAIDAFGAPSRVEPVPERNTRIIHVESSSFAQLIEGLFGTGSAEKRVPSCLWSAPVETQAKAVEALFAGDGKIERRGKSQRVQLQLTNEEIIDWVFQVGLRSGVQFSRHQRAPDGKLPVYWVSASVSTAIGTPLACLFDEVPEDFRITDRTKQRHDREVVKIGDVETIAYDGPVHNVEVAGTHTYIAEDLVVHNCETIAQGGTRRGAQMAVMRVSHPDVIEFIHAKNKDVSLAHCLKLNDPDDYTYTTFGEALEEARELIDEDGRVPKHLRNAVEGHLSNFNISVGITDAFMDALAAGEDYTFTNPRTGEPHIATAETKEMYERYDLGEYVEIGEELSVPADIIWDRIIDGAHENGEPGVIYLERVNKEHSFDVEEHPDHRILATNPCGEQPLEEYEACNLGHINLSTIAAEDAPDWRVWSDRHAASYDTEAAAIGAFLEEAIDWEEFDHRIEMGTRFLENVVTMSDFPVDEISETVRQMRKIGLGIMGLAQLYIQLGVKYGSDPANEIAAQLMTHINHGAKWNSHELAEERGVFGEWEHSKYADPVRYREWFEHQSGLDADDWADGFPIRNHNVTTIAPTGTTGMVGNTTGGCEPIFNVAYYKNVSDDVQGDEMLVEFDDYFLRTLEANDIDVEAVKEEAQTQMANNEFAGIDGLERVPDAIGELFVTTSDITAKEHAAVQCACQQGVDSAISKTVNAPNHSTHDDAREVFEFIYENGGKGVTYYRDGTRTKQVLTTRADNTEFSEMDEDEAAAALLEQIEEVFGGIEAFTAHEEVREVMEAELEALGSALVDADSGYAKPRDRPDVLNGVTQRIETGYGKLYVNINEDQHGRPFELFATIGNSGGFTNSFTEALAKTISTALRAGVDPWEIADELQGIRSPKVAWDKGQQINSVPDAIGTALQRYLEGEVDIAYPRQKNLTEIEEEQQEADQVEPDGGSAVSPPNADAGEADAMDDLLAAGESPECPECGSLSLHYSEGCKTCHSCGWSEC